MILVGPRRDGDGDNGNDVLEGDVSVQNAFPYDAAFISDCCFFTSNSAAAAFMHTDLRSSVHFSSLTYK